MMYKLLITISTISVALFQNPIISLSLGLILGFIMKDNLKRNSFLKWRQRVRGRKTKISSISNRFKSSNQKT